MFLLLLVRRCLKHYNRTTITGHRGNKCQSQIKTNLNLGKEETLFEMMVTVGGGELLQWEEENYCSRERPLTVRSVRALKVSQAGTVFSREG